MVAARRSTRRPSAPAGRSGRPNVPTDAVFTIDELVTYLKLPKSTIYTLAQEGEKPGHKVGRQWRSLKNLLDRWLGDDEQPVIGK